MSTKKNRSIIVWILIAVVAVAAFSQIKPFSMVVLPGYGYRAYELEWHVQFSNVLSSISGSFGNWQQLLSDETVKQWGAQTDQNGKQIVLYSGPTITSYDWQTEQYQDRVRASWKAEVHLWFYGYFPDNIAEAQKLPSHPLNPIGSFMDRTLFPRAYAITPVVWVLIAIIGGLIILTGWQYISSLTYQLIEKSKWDTGYDPYMRSNATIWEKLLYSITFAFESFLAWVTALGPTWIILVVGVVIVLVFAGTRGGKRR